jgi:hypothetical protein
LALARAGRSNAARIAIMAMTTKSSIRVKPADRSLSWSVADEEILFMGLFLLVL